MDYNCRYQIHHSLYCIQFIEKFKEVKEMTRQAVSQTPPIPPSTNQNSASQVNGNEESQSPSSSKHANSSQPRQFLHHRSSSLSAMQVGVGCFPLSLTHFHADTYFVFSKKK